MEHHFWILRLRFILLVLLQVAAMSGEAVTTTPSGKTDNSTKSRTDTKAEAVQNQMGPNNSTTPRPTLRSYQDFPGGTGVGSWQEISMYPTKESRNSRTLTDTNAQGLASVASSNYSSSSSPLHLATGLVCLTLMWRP